MSSTAELCECAIEALDRALRDQPDRLYDDVVAAVRGLVGFRDHLIDRQRTEGGADAANRLRRVNAILSMMVGGEYPISGLHRERLQKARHALDELQRETRIT